MSKVWKTNGPETNYLERLFREGRLHANSKPAVVQGKFPIFNGFSPSVFRKNFSLARNKCCPTNNLTTEDATIADFFGDRNRAPSEELDGVDFQPEKKIQKVDDAIESGGSKLVNCIQPPVIPCIYTDSHSKKEMCMVTLLLCNGVKGVHFDLVVNANGPEQTLVVKYNWPKSMYDVKDMFLDDDLDEMLAEEGDPEFQAVEKALRQFCENVDAAPVATIEIKLPVEVKQDPESWTKTVNKKTDGGVIVFIKFECIRKVYEICKNEKFLKID
ncbi:hypothetical protein HA402_005669 [Bradysia odoriphaga]|nr:hypothetical protein HA402_005669 [Bradysia odoriphaga]